jgi:hypothetical protein
MASLVRSIGAVRTLAVPAIALIAVTCVLALIAVTHSKVPAAWAFDGTTLYSHEWAPYSSYPRASASYPHMVRLRDGSLLATHDYGNDVIDRPGYQEPLFGLPIYRSSDDGRTWTRISYVADTRHSPPWQMYFPSLFEFPQALGPYPAGTLLLGVNSMSPDITNTSGSIDLDVYLSTDGGVMWSYLSTCDSQPAYTLGHGIWEPYFQVDAHGRLVCFFSDERPSNTARYAWATQLIVHRISTDGGQSWGPLTVDVEPISSTSNDRPGMPVVVRLPDGTYLMSFEACWRLSCATYLKRSSDGAAWGDPADYGIRIETADGRWLEGNPYLVWSPAGGPNGTLIAHGRTIRDASGDEVPESRTTLFVNTNLGLGPWAEVPSGTSYPPVVVQCDGYRASMLPTAGGHGVIFMTPVDAHYPNSSDNDPHCDIKYATSSIGSLPYYAPFASGNDAGWTTYGGSWSVTGEAYSNTTGGFGEKAVSGSTGWSDYTLQGDVRFDGLAAHRSDTGLLFRVTRPSTGVDALNGYYVGIDPAGTFFLGRMQAGQYAWLHAGEPLPEGVVVAGRWYHVVVQAVGCTFTVTAHPVGSQTFQTFTYTDSPCFSAGQIGVRTYGAQASWRNIVVTAGGTTQYIPVAAEWASGSAPAWTPYGGSWSVGSEEYRLTETEPGDKALTGHPLWGSSTVTADVKITSGWGDAGLVARVNDPAIGADSYVGYYAGLRQSDGRLIFGRANNGVWTQLGPGAVVPGGVTAGQWYRVTLEHVGCDFTISAQAVASHDKAMISYIDSGCFGTGQVGVRSYAADAAWRYFAMLPR